MTVTLEGRAIPETAPAGYDVAPSRCVFCGREVSHVNDGGIACVAGAFLPSGDVAHFLYCNVGGCSETSRAESEAQLWTCGNCHVDCLASRCHECTEPRHMVDRSILEPYDATHDVRTRRFAVVVADDRPDVPDGAKVLAVYSYAGTLGADCRVVVRFSCNGAAEAYRDHSPYGVELFEEKRTAIDAAESANHALWDRASRVLGVQTPDRELPAGSREGRVNLLESDDLPEATYFRFDHGVCLRSLDSQRYWLAVLRDNAQPDMLGAVDGTDGLCELLDMMLAQYVTDKPSGDSGVG